MWTLRDDARPEVRRWETSAETDRLIAAHSGYRRLAQPVTAVRSVLLDKVNHRLVVLDHFEGDGNHVARVPFHLDPNVAIEPAARGQWRLAANATSFLLVSGDVADWQPPVVTFKSLVGASLACNAGPHVTDMGIADGLTGEFRSAIRTG